MKCIKFKFTYWFPPSLELYSRLISLTLTPLQLYMSPRRCKQLKQPRFVRRVRRNTLSSEGHTVRLRLFFWGISKPITIRKQDRLWHFYSPERMCSQFLCTLHGHEPPCVVKRQDMKDFALYPTASKPVIGQNLQRKARGVRRFIRSAHDHPTIAYGLFQPHSSSGTTSQISWDLCPNSWLGGSLAGFALMMCSRVWRGHLHSEASLRYSW